MSVRYLTGIIINDNIINEGQQPSKNTKKGEREEWKNYKVTQNKGKR